MADQADVGMEADQADDGMEAALEEISKLSFWLWSIFFLTCLPGVFNTWVLFSNLFTLEVVPYWCTIPELKDVEWTNEEIREIVSADDPCYYLKYDYASLSKLPFSEAKKKANETKPEEVACSEFSYENAHRSAVAEWNMVCDRNRMRSVANMMVPLGKLTGSLLFGFIADKVGRKTSIVISSILYIAGGYWGASMLEYWVLVATLLMMGIAGTACYNVGLTLVMEIVNTKHRTKLGILYNMSYAMGYFTLALIAYFFETWYIQRRVLFYPLVILLIGCWFIPESPKWLLLKGKIEKAWKVIRYASKKAAAMRKEDSPTVEVNTVEETGGVGKKLKAFFHGLGEMIKHSELRNRLLITYVIWFTTALSYYAIGFSYKSFHSGPVLFAAVSGVVEALGYLIPIPVLHFVGRKVAISLGQLISGFLLVVTLFFKEEQALLPIAMISRLFNNAVYSIIYVFVNELFPTVNRGTAMGSGAMLGHLAGIVGNFMVMELEKKGYIVTIICAASGITSGLLVLILPETAGKDLPEDIAKIDSRVKEGEHVSIRNCCKWRKK